MYLIFSETFTRAMAKLGQIHPSSFHNLYPKGHRVGILQYADDMILFFSANKKWVTKINRLLTQYGNEFDQANNSEKSELIFSANLSNQTKRDIRCLFFFFFIFSVRLRE